MNPIFEEREHETDLNEQPDSGIYRIFITLDEMCEVRVGRLGTFTFPKGRYAYTGSAKRGLNTRLRRHLRKTKKLHWHIDYLLNQPGAAVAEVETYPYSENGECELRRSMQGRILVKGFGSSDCRNGCGSHLLFLGG